MAKRVIEWDSNGKIKLERSEQHIVEFERLATEFMRGRPYAAIADKDNATGKTVVRLRLLRDLPRDLGPIAGDAIHNLRSCLDSMWLSVVSPEGIEIRNRPTSQEFPIMATAESFENWCVSRLGRRKQGRANDIVSVPKSINPFPGGNDVLWMLHVADIEDKHRAIIPCLMSMRAIRVDLMGGLRSKFPELKDLPPKHVIMGVPPRGPLLDGSVLFEATKEQMEDNPEAGIEVSFGEPEILRGHQAISLVQAMLEEVHRIRSAFIAAGLLSEKTPPTRLAHVSVHGDAAKAAAVVDPSLLSRQKPP